MRVMRIICTYGGDMVTCERQLTGVEWLLLGLLILLVAFIVGVGIGMYRKAL